MPGKSVVLRANSQLFRIRREELLFGLRYRRSYGLPRRSAPRNDMQKLAACPHNTWALPEYCRKASLHPQARLRACHHEPRPCTRAHLPVFSMSLRTSAHTGAAIRVPAAMPGKSVVLRANSQLFRIRREELLFGLRYRRSYGLPRRFAPRNDMLKFAGCLRVQAPCSVAPRRHVLAAAEALLFFACHGNHAFATADTCPSSACHCEPVRTLVRQSASPQQYLASQ